MNFDKISLIDLIIVVALSVSLLGSLYIGDMNIANVLISGLLGYLGAKHIDKKGKDDV